MLKRHLLGLGLALGLPLTIAGPALAQTPAPLASVEVSLPAPPGRLAGTLLLPADARPQTPVVLILAGSGPNDRNGDAPMLGLRSGHLRLLAEALAERGVGSLRVDKRAVGGSAGAATREESLRFSAYVDDAGSWLRFLRRQRPQAPLLVLGHSEGALVGTMASRRERVDGLVLVAGAGRPAAEVLREQFEAGLPPPLREQALAILAALQRGEAAPDVPPALVSAFRPSVQPYLRSWLPIDPAAELARTSTPTLVVQGATDLQVGMADARRLAAARPGVRLVEIAGMNHVLKAAPLDRAANTATYADPALPLAPGLVDAVADFIRGVAPAG